MESKIIKNNKSVQLKNDEIPQKIERIETILDDLVETMKRYVDDVEYIWDKRLSPFVTSGDCMTMQGLIERGFKTFLDFMTSQKTFKIMIVSRNRLLKRKKYLEYVNKKHNTTLLEKVALENTGRGD